MISDQNNHYYYAQIKRLIEQYFVLQADKKYEDFIKEFTKVLNL